MSALSHFGFEHIFDLTRRLLSKTLFKRMALNV